jgi:hypothetical protein
MAGRMAQLRLLWQNVAKLVGTMGKIAFFPTVLRLFYDF